MSAIRIVRGEYRKRPVADQVFSLVSGFQSGAKGSFVTVKNGGNFPNCPDTIRIRVDNISDIEYTNGMTDTTTNAAKAVAAPAETEEQAIERIRERFDILHEMTKAAVTGDIRAMIVSGPPGVGKSYGVEKIVEAACLFDKISGKRLRAEVVKGSATPIGLYQTLYKYSDKNCVLVFDDCDSILLDDVSLNLLKGALDTGKKRKISWLSESSTLRREGIPDQFNFNGTLQNKRLLQTQRLVRATKACLERQPFIPGQGLSQAEGYHVPGIDGWIEKPLQLGQAFKPQRGFQVVQVGGIHPHLTHHHLAGQFLHFVFQIFFSSGRRFLQERIAVAHRRLPPGFDGPGQGSSAIGADNQLRLAHPLTICGCIGGRAQQAANPLGIHEIALSVAVHLVEVVPCGQVMSGIYPVGPAVDCCHHHSMAGPRGWHPGINLPVPQDTQGSDFCGNAGA